MQPLPPPPPPGASKESLRRHYRQLRRQSLPLAEPALLEVLATALPLALEAADARADAQADAQPDLQADALGASTQANSRADARADAQPDLQADAPGASAQANSRADARACAWDDALGSIARADRPAAAAPSAAGPPSSGSAPLRIGPRRLGLYWPVGHEPDWRPLLQRWPEALRQRLALPVVRRQDGVGRLTYGAWHPTDPLLADGCGIPAPVAAAPLEPQSLALLLVPALAMDQRGIRLGSGGGWYDRLRADPAWRRVPALAVLPAACLAPSLPVDPWDVPFSGWLDETGGPIKVSGFD